jgi:hypothetical protein
VAVPNFFEEGSKGRHGLVDFSLCYNLIGEVFYD